MFKSDITSRALAWLVFVAGISTPSIVFVWVWVLQLSGLLALLSALTLLVLFDSAYLARLLAPIRRWQQGAKGDEELRAADWAIQRAPVRFAGLSAINSVLVFSLLIALSALGVGVEQRPGEAEIAAGVMVVVGVCASTPGTLLAALRGLLHDVQEQISLALVERGIELERPRFPLSRIVFTASTMQIFAVFIGLGGGALFFRTQGLRDAHIVEQQRRAEVTALRLAAGEELELQAGVSVVEVEALPAELLAIDSQGSELVLFDPVTERAMAAAPVGDGRWVIADAEAEFHTWLFAGAVLLLALASIPMTTYGTLSLIRTVKRPIAALESAARSFVEHGEIEALGRVVALRNDELGDLSRSFNRMLDVLSELSQATTAVAGGDLRVGLERSGDIQDAFRSMLEQLRRVVEQIHRASQELATTASQLQATTAEQQAGAQLQSVGVSEVSASVASLASSAGDITEVARGVLDDAELARSTTDATVERITELSRQAAGIGELLDVIREIAERSDLLALNGSLEAVRAGEAGRGFALVAAEMRRLAERVTGIVRDVHQRVVEIEAASASTVAATADSRALAQRTADAARRISTLTARQGEDTGRLSETMAQVAEIVVAGASVTGQTSAAAEQLRRQAQELERLIGEFEIGEKTP